MEKGMLDSSVKVWLVAKGYTQAQIARDLNIIEQTVWKTINGRDRNRKVFGWLKKHGYFSVESARADKSCG